MSNELSPNTSIASILKKKEDFIPYEKANKHLPIEDIVQRYKGMAKLTPRQ